MRQIADSVRWRAAHPIGIDCRLRELDQEWDVGRTLEAKASVLAFTGVMLGATVDKRWLALPRVHHRLPVPACWQGWRPPVPITHTSSGSPSVAGELDECCPAKLLWASARVDEGPEFGDLADVGLSALDVALPHGI